MSQTLHLPSLPFATDAGIGHRARIGLITLATDYTLEHDYRTILAGIDGVALYSARLPSSEDTTPATLVAMADHIAPTAALILPGDRVDVVAFGCSSATALLGEDRVIDLIRQVKPNARVTTPITAACAAFRAIGAQSIGMLTPYTADVNAGLIASFTDAGFEVPLLGSFDEPREAVVGAITEATISQSVLAIAGTARIDAFFISCTNLRAMSTVAGLERELGLAVTTSNHAMIWHSLRLAGVNDEIRGAGLLYGLGT